MKRKHLLIIEDDKILSKTIEQCLKGRYDVDAAYDGGEGLLYAKQEIYDLIILDIMMPVMDGYETTAIIRKFSDKVVADIPIVAITAEAFAEEKSKAFNAGMNAYLVKPVDMPSLLKVLMLFLRDNKRS